MSFATWSAFVAASTVLLLVPGPTILLVVSYAIGQGRRVALPVAAGVALGDFTAMTLSMLGIGALLSTSATLFTALKWVGAAYLVWLGIKLFRAGGGLHGFDERQEASPTRMIAHAWIVTTLNPKAITFFVAFLPQFLDPARPLFGQMLVFESTFLALAAANAFGYALVASRARSTIGRPSVLRWVNRAGGSVLVGAGVATIAVDRLR